MSARMKRFCRADGCKCLTTNKNGYCDSHQYIPIRKEQESERRRDQRRGSSNDRGYTSRWRTYSKWFLAQPQNRLCALRLDDGCAIVAQCVDHIDPPDGANDPRFWRISNHQPACIHCNSLKNNRMIVGSHRIDLTDDPLLPADD